MARGFQGAVMRGFGARDHEATVVEAIWLAPHVRRVRLVAPTLFEDAEAAPTSWLRFWIPDPEGGATEFQRAYTIIEADEGTGAFAVDVVMHEPAGPASLWARQVTGGETVMITSLGSSRFDVPEEPPAGYLLVGDSASIPAINEILAVLPDDVAVELYLERHDENDALIPLVSHPRARLSWVPRLGATSLADAIQPRDWSDWYAWVAAESGSVKHVRARLKDEFGFPKSEVHARAYWFHGRAMGKLRAQRDSATTTPAPVAPPPPEAVDRTSPQSARAPVPAPDLDSDLEPAADPVPDTTAPDLPATGDPVSARSTWRTQAAGRLMAPLRPTFVVAGVLQAVVTLVQLAPFVLLVELARRLVAGAGPERLWTVGVAALVLMGGGALLGSVLLVWLHVVDARFSHGLRKRLLSTLARVPLGWFTARGSGAVKKLVQDDTLSLHYLVTHAVLDAVAAVVAPVAVLVYLFAVDWRIALALFVPVLVYIVTMVVMVVQSGPKPAQAMRWAQRMNTEAAGYLEGQPVIRVFGGAAASTFRARLDEYVAFLKDWQWPFTGKKTVMDLATRPTTFVWLIAAIGTPLAVTGAMDAADLLPFLLLGTTFGARLLGIGYGLSGIRDGALAARGVQATLDEPTLDAHETGADAAHGSSSHDTPGTVVFDRVGFGYRPGVPVIHDVSLTLEPGTVTALVGPSGSGKSTLAALLARFHDVGDGAIRVGGRDIRTLTADQLYTRVGFVFQDTQLVHGTVRENIALAVPDAGQEQVEAAARAARVHDRVLRLPHGYDTLLGSDAALSGGERQRLTVARAILADTPVMVLDEATAFADPESEYLVQQALNRLTEGRTVLVIAHRLHTVVAADRIVVLHEGRVAESGTHDQLLATRGRYRALWDAGQSRTSVPEEAAR